MLTLSAHLVSRFDSSLQRDFVTGYITVDEKHGRKLFYYFVTSERSPKDDPIVLW